MSYGWKMKSMKPVEAGAKKKMRKRNLRNAALMAIGAAGIIAVAAVAPNMFQILGRTGALARLKYRSKGVLARLKQKGEIEFVERDGKKYAQLTDRGEKALDLNREKLKIIDNKPKKWDRRCSTFQKSIKRFANTCVSRCKKSVFCATR